jgi:succinate dehydrogenase / fumarate reductase cytochrome b subunit
MIVFLSWRPNGDRMRSVGTLYQSSVGKKLVMAVSGLALFGFVVGHMAGNLKMFLGPEAFNGYAHYLREIGSHAFGHGGLLWVARGGLLVALLAHVITVISLVRQSRRARAIGYKRFNDQSFSYASRTMRWGGLIVFLFIVYHLLHLTFGTVHPDFDVASPYANVVAGFKLWWVSLIYAVAVIMLGLHIQHGLWSSTQTLALHYPVVLRLRMPISVATSAVIVMGYLSVPVAVLANWVR